MKELINKQLWAYGFLPLLRVLEILEQESKFELCSLIVQVLNEHSKRFGFKIPTVYNEEAIALLKHNMKTYFDLSGDIAVGNNESYAKKILKLIRAAEAVKQYNKQEQTLIESKTTTDSEHGLTAFNKALKVCLNTKPIRGKKK